MKSMESHSNALIIWLIVFGVTLILVVGGAAYFLSAPSAPVVTTNGSAGATNGSGMAGNNSSRESGTKWQKGHYANLFYEFDYPDIFKITRETVISDHSVDANGKEIGRASCRERV